jgi:hypothetical protein
MMFNDATGMFLLLVSFGLTFFVARFIGKRIRARRAAEEAAKAERDLARQSRQVRRAAARQKKG